MKKKKIGFMTWLTDKMFDEKINDRFCKIGIAIGAVYITTIVIMAIIKGIF